MNKNTSDSDLFKIYISNTDAFSWTMTFSRGVNNFASQLAIFDVVGRGVRADDDAADGSPQAAIATGALTGQPWALITCASAVRAVTRRMLAAT